MKINIKLESGWQLLAFILVTLGLLFAIVVFQLWLWHVIFVAAFELPQLTFWQMVALNVFCDTLLYTGRHGWLSVMYKGEEL